MAKFKRVSADEAQSKRKDHVKDGAGGPIMVKGFKAPPSWNKEARSARFIMSSESVDRYMDIVVQAGLETDRFMQNPQGLLFHNSRSWPCGLWSDVTKVLGGRPKRTEGTLNFLPEGTDEDADRAARHVAAGSLRTVSIGFRPDWDEIDFILDDDENWTGGFRYNKSELLETSLCPIPAQPDALVKDAGGDWKMARELIEEVLDTYAKTPEGLLIPLDAYEKAYRRTVEKIAEGTATVNQAREAQGVEPLPATDGIEKEAQDAPEAADAPETEKAAEAAVEKDAATPVANEQEAKGIDLLTDEVLDAFAGQMKGDCHIWLNDEHGEIKLCAFETSTDVEVAELVLPVDLTVAQIKEVQASIWARVAAAKTAPEPEKKTIGTVSIEVDTAEATEKVNALSKLFDSLAEKMNRFFGAKAVEPEVVEPPAPPSAEAIEAARSKAAAIRDRLATKGLIEA